jgi:NitT/TauT family transport system substrate-binding protein
MIRKPDFDYASKKDMYGRYFRAWTMGLEYGHINPRAATQIVMKLFPGLSSQMTPGLANNFYMAKVKAFAEGFGAVGRLQGRQCRRDRQAHLILMSG